jgi:hypothetical protein
VTVNFHTHRDVTHIVSSQRGALSRKEYSSNVIFQSHNNSNINNNAHYDDDYISCHVNTVVPFEKQNDTRMMKTRDQNR